MTELKEIPLDRITPPEDLKRLHPVSSESPQGWEQFKRSVNQELQKPLEVMETDDGYQLIDGDRRFRALKEGESEDVKCIVRQEQDETERWIKMIRANEFRKPSDKQKRAELLARLCQPWLLPPAERESYTQVYQQQEIADMIGTSQPTISIWLDPVKEKNSLRCALGEKVPCTNNRMTNSDVGIIDEVYHTLVEDGPVSDGSQSDYLANEISDMDEVTIHEIKTAVQHSVDMGHNTTELIDYLHENYVFEDSPEISDEIDPSLGGFDDDHDLDTSQVSDVDIEPEFTDNPEWFDCLSEQECELEYSGDYGNHVVAQFTGSAAVAINTICERYDLETSEFMDLFLEDFITAAVNTAEKDPESFNEIMEELSDICADN